MQNIVIDNVEVALKRLFSQSLKAAFPQLTNPIEPVVSTTKKGNSDYQFNNTGAVVQALGKAGVTITPATAAAASSDAAAPKPTKPSPQNVGEALVGALPANDLIEKAEATPQGFINIFISRAWTQGAMMRVLQRGVQPPEVQKEKVLIDFSSPNIAKDLHVGHLRSTIIGESLARVFEFCGHDTARINHVGDWGTQFGMLILYLKNEFPNFLSEPPQITDLVEFYKMAKKKFDEDPAFKTAAREEVVKLQAYEDVSIQAWKMICDISRKEFEEIYSRLQVRLDERGESFYNRMLPDIINSLEARGLVEVDDGAKIITSTRNVAVNAMQAADMSRLMNILIKKKKTGEVVWDTALVKLLKEKGIITGEGADEMIKVSKKAEAKKFTEFDTSEDPDRLVTSIESLYKPVLHKELVDSLRTRGVIIDAAAATAPKPPPTAAQLASDAALAASAAAAPEPSSDAAAAAASSSSATTTTTAPAAPPANNADSAAAAASDAPVFVKVPMFKMPLMLRKSDGGFTYDSTDIAAMYHRFVSKQCDRVVYVTDKGQFDHFEIVAQAAMDAGWLQAPKKWDHAGFGLVTGENGRKIATRSGDSAKLKHLLDEARDRAYEQLKTREESEQKQGHSEEEMCELARKIGYGAVKYFDLRQNRKSDYAFAFDKVLSMEGNTAVFLLYSYARIQSIKRKCGVEDVMQLIPTTEIVLESDYEKALALNALKLGSVVLKTAEDLMPKNITDFCYDLVNSFSAFFRECRVHGNERQNSRLLLIEVVRLTLQTALEMLGIEVADRL